MVRTPPRPPGVRIDVVLPTAINSVQAPLVDVYRRAFRHPPYAKSESEVAKFAHFFPIHATAPGFRLVVAVATDTQKVVGFAYGRTAIEGQPWRDLVTGPLQAAGLGHWLVDAYIFTEFAVLPAAQRRGIGSRLHDRLLRGLPHRRALLTTIAAGSPATHFYLSKGWRVLLGKLVVPGNPRAYRVMGLELPKNPQRAP